MAEVNTSRVDREISRWRVAFRLFALLLILLAGAFALSANFGSARFEAIFAEMLGGQALPALTQFVFANRGALTLVFLFLIIAASIGILVLKNRGVMILIGIATVLLLFLGAIAIVVACFSPLISIVSELSEA